MSPNPDDGSTAAATAFVERRKQLGISQEQVRQKCGLSVSSLIDFEKARSWPRARTQALLEDVAGWPPGTLNAIRAGKPAPGQPTAPAETDPAAQLVLDGLRHVERLAMQAVQIARDPVAAVARLAAVSELYGKLAAEVSTRGGIPANSG